MSHEEDDTLEALRAVWGTNTQTAEDLAQFCPTVKVCKNVENLGIKGMDDENMAGSLRSEWKKQLAADGKVPEDVQTIGQLVAALDESQR